MTAPVKVGDIVVWLADGDFGVVTDVTSDRVSVEWTISASSDTVRHSYEWVNYGKSFTKTEKTVVDILAPLDLEAMVAP